MMTRLLLFIFFVSSPLAACAQTTIDDETMQPVASALTKVAAAVDAYVAWTPGADALSSTELLYAATAHDPALLVPFEDYLLKTSAQGRDSAVLVCTADGRRALVEDAGCTARSDLAPWRRSSAVPCVFSLNLDRVCRQ